MPEPYKIFIMVLIILGAAGAVGWSNQTQQPVLFVVDASGSMWGRVGSVEKIVVAKGTLVEMLGSMAEEDWVGLIAYGHRREGDCDDIELLAPIQAGQLIDIVEGVQKLNPKGKTPIVRSLRLAAEQVETLSEDVAVVLLSDGEENCDAAPCDFVRSLVDQGVRLKLFVIGFDVTTDQREQLTCLAEAGRGAYFSAETAAGLQHALQKVTQQLAQTEDSTTGSLMVTASGNDIYTVFDATGDQRLESARTNTAVDLLPGFYRVTLGASSQLAKVRPGQQTIIGAGSLVVTGLGKDLYSVFDVTGEKKVDFTRTNRPMDLLEGSYLVELAGTRRITRVTAGETTSIKAASVVVKGSSDSLYELYDPTGENKYEFTRVGRSIEILPGFYSIKVGSHWIRDIDLTDGQQLALEEPAD